jgi:bifunctional non-homologous end joining protein LigD
MPLDVYKKKRDFAKTPEPSGDEKRKSKQGAGLVYAIQKHRATRLHYDLRLEWNGVLLSWAIPKGPSFDPSMKRLAAETEDHPLDYADFEGVIPAEEYGGGTVMLWDRGTWTPESPDVDAALKKGDLKFAIHGEKLSGSWVLVRIRSWDKKQGERSWLLIKHRDAFASTDDVTLAKPWSVATSRSLKQIAIDGGGDAEKAAEADPPATSGPPRQAAAKPRARPRASGTGSRGSAAPARGTSSRSASGSPKAPRPRKPK